MSDGMHELDTSSALKFLSDLSCVAYECSTSFDVVFVSENIFDLIGIPRKTFLGNRSLWEQWVPPEDQSLLLNQMSGLKQERAGSLIHRFFDVDGLPLWVCNRMQLVELDKGKSVRGCVVPVAHDRMIYGLEPGLGSLFAHKLANQFQILGMMLSSLGRSATASSDVELFQQTLDRAAEFARTFSQYNQIPSAAEGLRILNVVESVLASLKGAFRQKGISVTEELDPALEETVISGDAFYLDLALHHVLQNSLEATAKNGKVAIRASAKLHGRRPTVRLLIADTGRGMNEAELAKSPTLYFSTKKNHDGVGLSLARRFVEWHNGSLRINSNPGKGTEVEILLPARRVTGGAKFDHRRV